MSRAAALILALVASYASILGLYFTLQPPGGGRPYWHLILIAIATMLFFTILAIEIRDHFRSSPKRLGDKTQIELYMRNWISSGGRTVLFTRDMSWVDGGSLKILMEKAKRKELIICLEKQTDHSEKLRAAGAEVYTYGHLGFRPSARFTIVDFQRDGARVAVGSKLTTGPEQMVQEFRQGDHPFFAVAEDLVHFAIAASKT